MTPSQIVTIYACRAAVMAARVILAAVGYDFGWCDSCGEPDTLVFDAVRGWYMCGACFEHFNPTEF